MVQVNSDLYHIVRDSFDIQVRLYLRLQAMNPARIAKFDNVRDLIAAQEDRLRFVPKSIRTVDFERSNYKVTIQGGVLGLRDAKENYVRIADGQGAFLTMANHLRYGVDGDIRISMDK